MGEQKNWELAKATYDALCQTLDKNDWKYDRDDESLMIDCGAQGDDLPIHMTIDVDVERLVVLVFSHIPFQVPEDKRVDAAIAINAINCKLVDGYFGYNITTGNIVFRMTNAFTDSTLGEDAFLYMVLLSCRIIDEYNDKFLMFIKGILSLEQLLANLADE